MSARSVVLYVLPRDGGASFEVKRGGVVVLKLLRGDALDLLGALGAAIVKTLPGMVKRRVRDGQNTRHRAVRREQ